MRSTNIQPIYSAFDPDAFLSPGNEITDSFDTTIAKVPPGEYRAQVDKIAKPRKFQAKSGDEMVAFDITWAILDEDVKAETELAKPTSRQTIFLDINEDGSLARGKNKNVGLGRLREALGQNQPGQPWNPNMLVGALAMVKIEHSPNERNPDDPFANVVAVAALD